MVGVAPGAADPVAGVDLAPAAGALSTEPTVEGRVGGGGGGGQREACGGWEICILSPSLIQMSDPVRILLTKFFVS